MGKLKGAQPSEFWGTHSRNTRTFVLYQFDSLADHAVIHHFILFVVLQGESEKAEHLLHSALRHLKYTKLPYVTIRYASFIDLVSCPEDLVRNQLIACTYTRVSFVNSVKY